MKRVEMEADQMPGQDSFLDVITNIVGILILLVLVVGLRTSRAVHSAPAEQPIEAVSSQDQLQKASNEVLTRELHVRDLVHQVGVAQRDVNFREMERSALSTAIVAAEQAIAARRAELSTEEQRDFDLRHQLKDAQAKLDELTREQIAMVSQETDAGQIECQPTAISKLVRENEIFVLLSEDHVVIVPMEELKKAMFEDIKENVWRLEKRSEFMQTIGPINGFRLTYVCDKADVMRTSDAGTYTLGSIPRFSHCDFEPVVKPAGEPAGEALLPNSELMQHLKAQRAEGTTVTFCVHPGNYDRLMQLKRAVREMGFQIAVRPLPKGSPMGAAPNGTPSLAE
jgi:hypothetical protein